MNNFTIEELELLKESLESWLDSYSDHPEYEGNLLITKIGSLIDNYCKTHPHVYQFTLGPGYCENCGEPE